MSLDPAGHLHSGTKKNMLLGISGLQRKALLKAFRHSFSSANRWHGVFVKGSHLPTHHGSGGCINPQRCINVWKKAAFCEPANPNYAHTLLIDLIKANVAGTQMQSRFSCAGERSATSVKQTARSRKVTDETGRVRADLNAAQRSGSQPPLSGMKRSE